MARIMHTCPWCHAGVWSPAPPALPYCSVCGHRADLARADCDCEVCDSVYLHPSGATGATVDAPPDPLFGDGQLPALTSLVLDGAPPGYIPLLAALARYRRVYESIMGSPAPSRASRDLTDRMINEIDALVDAVYAMAAATAEAIISRGSGQRPPT